MKTEKKKSVKGFTLVELIIVIAIIGILAGILIPTMTGKVKEAKKKTAADGAAKVAEMAAVITSEMEAKGCANSFFDSTAYSTAIVRATVMGDADESAAIDSPERFRYEMEKSMPTLKNANWAVAFNAGGGVKYAFYCENNSKYIGIYPDDGNEYHPDGTAGFGGVVTTFLTTK